MIRTKNTTVIQADRIEMRENLRECTNRSNISFNDIKEEISKFVREECPWKGTRFEETVPVENVDRNVQSTCRT